MKNKGFVLMETIVVIVVISVALLTIFYSYNKILTKVKGENKYDTSEYIYATYYIKKSLSSSIDAQDIDTLSNITNYFTSHSEKTTLENLYGVEKIYILKNLNKFSSAIANKFDAYMVDYIKKLDVRDDDKLIIVEYKKEAKIPGTNNPLIDSNNEQLYETYIASLEW